MGYGIVINMKTYKTSVVCGKFYPFHKGHHYLIESACKDSDKVVVMVCWRSDESLPVDIRVQSIKESFPNVEVIAVPCIPDDDDSIGWGKYTIDILGYVPDAVFSSEDYGEPYANAMGCKHVMVDHARKIVPCSGTMIRENPMKYFDYLASPSMRAFYALRIVIVGAESTGTTTLAEALAKYFQTVCVPEYGRTYTKWKYGSGNKEWKKSDFQHIALEQNRLEDMYAGNANKVLICDTDSVATSLWAMRYGVMIEDMSFNSEFSITPSYERGHSIYILTGDEIPFVQDKDNLRDGEDIRHKMHKKFESLLNNNRHRSSHIIVRGTHGQRMKNAIDYINRLIKTNGGTVCPYCEKAFKPGETLTSDYNEDVCHIECFNER